MKIVSLAEQPSAIKVVAAWFHDEWGYMHVTSSAADIEADLASHCHGKALPQTFVAIIGGETVGAAELKIREVVALPEYEHWLGGVYVSPGHRGKGIASRLAQHVSNTACNEYGVASLYLQTDEPGGGLYKKLGWSEVTRLQYGQRTRLVMVRHLVSQQPRVR